ncbi:MAG: ATP-binding cassette domain-containing protein, partial [Oscillospiraceae bacterium]|nr:ATP-binding cassette domain-containing protein [Oscillospiraceae bacterium]
MVELRDLHVKFNDSTREAVAGIDLVIHDGEVLGLVGESGSGKTVTAMTLSGLIERKKVTCRGQVLLDGEDLLPRSR